MLHRVLIAGGWNDVWSLQVQVIVLIISTTALEQHIDVGVAP
jgi:hypothetical protein